MQITKDTSYVYEEADTVRFPNIGQINGLDYSTNKYANDGIHIHFWVDENDTEAVRTALAASMAKYNVTSATYDYIPMPRKTFFGSFGCGQTFGRKSVLIKAQTIDDARYAMFATFGGKFCSVYADDYMSSEYFQPPVMGLQVDRMDEYDEKPGVSCFKFYPENLDE